jgi:hypothetical protein
VLAGGPAADHDAGVAGRHDSAADRDLHGQPLHEQPAHRLHGRPPAFRSDVVVRTFNGESIGKWEGDTLVVDTTSFVNDHHWIDAGIPATDALHIVERMRLLKGGTVLEIEYTLTDPKSWEGEMKWTKRWNRVDDQEVTEVTCTPDLNSHIPSTQSEFQAK